MEAQRPKSRKIEPPTVVIERPAAGDRELLIPVEDDFNNVPDSEPSAPPPEPGDLRPSPLDDIKVRQKFLQKLYLLIAGQMTIFGTLTALFVYIPHLRHIFRKKVFDQLFLNSFLGFPLGVGFLSLIMFPELRRRFSWMAVTLLTACLSFLFAYIATYRNTKVLLSSVMVSDLCCLGVVSLSSIPRLDLTSKKGLIYFPAFMMASNAVYPRLLHFDYSQTIVPAILSTGLMTYLGYNTRSMVRNKRLNLQKNEYPFGASQAFMNFDPFGFFERHFRGRR